MYLGIDLGTGSVKLMLVDGANQIHTASSPYRVEAPEAGFAETDPAAWIVAIRDAVARLPDLTGLKGIGFSGQMHGVVAVDREGAPLMPAILWADQRGGPYLGRFDTLPPAMRLRLLNTPVAGMAATTLLWLKHERPALYDRTATILFPKDYVRLLMTGAIATDYSDASGSLLYDFETRDWCLGAVDTLGLRTDFLPPIHPSLSQAGQINASGARLFGLPEGTPVAVGGGDAPVGMYGSGLRSSDEVQISVGSGAQIFRPIETDRLPDLNPSLNVFEGIATHDRYQVAAMLNAGIVLEWARAIVKSDWHSIYARLNDRHLGQAPSLLFLPYLNGERTPYMSATPCGAWLGLSLNDDAFDMMFAALLGVACTIRLGLETLDAAGEIRTIRAVGGSLRHEYWRRLLASVIGQPLVISERTDISAFGAVRIASDMLQDTLRLPEDPTTVYQPSPLPWIENYFSRFKQAYSSLINLT
ncbi:xylulokinase [Martelella endophytica]|uniref:Xylulose kinase n=1 Tax=Martelella endophytica TaxID=1486262 RepID=A0A0D5LU76_MAREN|nr:FGGY family carbohydrate kinase [Martelella endophytica]AJY47322.1 hypothetical protein TM49_19275 [Martelella endophytica]